ncbi:MAG TPA: sialidase family protein [Candidatus Limnocylindrales bacterium]
MNDTELEAWLVARFRAAPTPEPPPNLQAAVRDDQIRASSQAQSARPSRMWGLARPRRALGGMVALAFTLVLAAGLLAVVVIRPSQSTGPASPGIAWQPRIQVAGPGIIFGPYLATVGGRLYMVATSSAADGTESTVVRSASDGKTWEQISAPGAFEKDGPRFFAQGISDDGKGGLIVVGGLPGGEAESIVPAAWHSTDGRTWARAQVGTPALARMSAVTARPGAIVAIGDGRVVVNSAATGADQSVNQMYAWFSSDGNAWSQVVLPDSSGFIPSAISSWGGGFAAIAQLDGITLSSSVWTSADGRTWQKSPQDFARFTPTAMAGFGGRLVAVGNHQDPQSTAAGFVPASWSSTDGRTWVESRASARQVATGFGDVAVVGATLVAIGANYMGQAAVTLQVGGPTPVPTPAANVWVSSDGTTWRLLTEDPSLIVGSYLNTHVAGLGTRAVVATYGEVYFGDLTP